jgi:hypothetical protein
MFLAECGLVLIAVILAFAAPTTGSRFFQVVERPFARLARRRRMAVVVVGVTALAVHAMALPILHIPSPGFHDEFSYLLMGDTFAHGRLTNPTHPMWIHFETFHVNWKPSYCSKYYPAQGVILAIGQVLFGNPFWGVWLSAGVMCVAICWMLQAWVASVWALLGGMLAIPLLGTFSYWAHHYWGGAAAAIGGSLVLGALPRIKRQQRVRDAAIMGLGVAILINSRPYESLFLCVPVGIALVLWTLGTASPSLRQKSKTVILPLGVVLMIGAGATMYYYWRTTGSPLRPPYIANMQAYNPIPFFPWQPVLPAPHYNHKLMQSFYSVEDFDQYQSARLHPLDAVLIRTANFWLFFLGPLLTLPLCISIFTLPSGMSLRDISPSTRFLLLICLLGFIGLMLTIYFAPHYAAPFTPAIYGLVMLAMRRARKWQWRGKRTGIFVVRALPSIAVFLLLLRLAASPLHLALRSPLWAATGSLGPQMLDRARISSQMVAAGGHHLMIVRYSPEHNRNSEWVYNGADIDGAPVVWARDMGWSQNEELIRYFKDRHVWLVEPDENPPKLTAYGQAVGISPSR